MKTTILLVALCLALTACDKEVSREWGEPVITTERTSCTHFAYCMTCMPGFGGKMSCGFKASAFCPGTQLSRVRETPFVATYESGETSSGSTTEIIEYLEPCL